MGGIQTYEKLEVNLFCGKLVGKLCEKMLKFTSGRIVDDAEGITNGFEDSAPFLTRSVSLRSELVDSVNVLVSFVIGTGEKPNSAVKSARGVRSQHSTWQDEEWNWQDFARE